MFSFSTKDINYPVLKDRTNAVNVNRNDEEEGREKPGYLPGNTREFAVYFANEDGID